MADPTLRVYRGKDVDMLTACGTIISHAMDNSAFLISKRPTWAAPFFSNLATRIQDAFPNILGIDNAQAMRQATKVVTDLQTAALSDLADFKVQVEEDFKGDKPRRAEIFLVLGFTAHHKAAQGKDQEALVELLVKFKANMNPPLLAEITTAGTDPAVITAIIAYADLLRDSNINQESLKGNRKTLTAAGVTELNSIYNDVIKVARISAKFFKNDPTMVDKFSYTKTMAVLNGGSTPTPPPTPPTP